MKKLSLLLLTALSVCLISAFGCMNPSCTHQFTEWQTTPPTCLTAGENVRTCTLCGGTERETIPAIGHDYVDGVCLNCGGGTDACVHDFDEWYDITPATCLAGGEHPAR